MYEAIGYQEAAFWAAQDSRTARDLWQRTGDRGHLRDCLAAQEAARKYAWMARYFLGVEYEWPSPRCPD